MRAFVFLLILVNLLFLAWAQGYFGGSANPDAFRMQQQLLADRVNVVARDEPPPETTLPEKVVKAVEKKGETEVCLLLSELPTADVEMLENRLAEKLSAFKSVRSTIPGSVSYWVFIPPLANKQEVDAKVAELKKLGVPEFFVVQETGPNNRAISLGLFSSKDAAASRLEVLRGQGVKSAKLGERNVKPASISLEIRGPGAQTEALQQTLAEVLPESKATACKSLLPVGQ